MKKYKNANGTGSITKVKINRTNPFRVRVTNPVTKKRHSLGYFSTKKEATEILNKYFNNPYNLENHRIKFKDLFELFKKISVPIHHYSILTILLIHIFLIV